MTNGDRGTGDDDATREQEDRHESKRDETSKLSTRNHGRKKASIVDDDLNFFDRELSPSSTTMNTRSKSASQHTSRETNMRSQTTTTSTNTVADTLSQPAHAKNRLNGSKRKRTSFTPSAETQAYFDTDDEEEDDHRPSSSCTESSDEGSHLVVIASKNKQLAINKYKDPVKIYEAPTLIQTAIHDSKIAPPKMLEWINIKHPFLFRDPSHIPPIHSDCLDDVICGKAFIHISSPIDITIPCSNDRDISFTDIRNEWEDVKDNIAYVNAIPTGWGNDSVPDPIHRRRSSRFYLKEDKFTHAPKNRFKYLPTMVNKARTVLSEYCNASLKETDPRYVLRQSSIIFDDGSYPHIQKPHTDFHTDNIRQQKPSQEPLSVMYAVDTFSLIIFPRGKGEIGGNTGTRVVVPKGCSIWFTYRLWHSGDIYVVTDDCPKNCRIHFFAIQDSIYREGGMHDNLVDRRKERDDLLHQAVDFINVIDVNDVDAEFQKIKDETETFGDSCMLDNRMQVVYCNLLLLYDFLGFTMQSCNKHETTEEQKRIKDMYDYAYVSYTLHMKEMWGILTRLHDDKEIEINVLGENNEIIWKNN